MNYFNNFLNLFRKGHDARNNEKSRQQNAFAKIVEEMEEALSSDMNKESFLGLVDARKHQIYKELGAEYPQAYAKLMTLKLTNLIVGKYHYINRHTRVVSRPIELMIDPSNACQLSCPGCVHSSSEKAKRAKYDSVYWPPGMLSPENYEKIMRLYGPFAFGAILYNYGEPFLNSQTTKYIQLARKYMAYTSLSSNLSFKLDAEEVVNSGLNHMIISLDGVTQEVYERYRRGGKLDLVLENVRNLVEAKKKAGSSTPYLVWQFLTFEHNVHEVDAAIALAKEIGVDAIQIRTPNDVSHDDPNIVLVKTPQEGYHFFKALRSRVYESRPWPEDVGTDAYIEDLFRENLVERMTQIGGIDEPNRRGEVNCGWLYKNITVDGLGRIMPCCTPPAEWANLIFGKMEEAEEDYWNLPDFIHSRLSLSDREAFLEQSSSTPSYCGECEKSTDPPHDLWRVAQDLPYLVNERVLSSGDRDWLTDWS